MDFSKYMILAKPMESLLNKLKYQSVYTVCKFHKLAL